MFYLVCNSPEDRDGLIMHLKDNGIHAVFHYLSLQKSEFCKQYQNALNLPNCDHYTSCLLRLPLFYLISAGEIQRIIKKILDYYEIIL